MTADIKIKVSNKNVIYSCALDFMQVTVNKIIDGTHNELIWFLNHDNIYTCGTSADRKEILRNVKIPIIKTNRGGKTTYHGPGQRIVYLMINLNKRKKDIKKFINIIEMSVICLLKEFNIESKTFSDRIGIWVTNINGKKLQKEKKIGAIGLRVKKWVTYHGLSFNLNPNLDYYKNIYACGLKDYSVTSMKELGLKLSQKEFDKIFIKHFTEQLKRF